MLIHQILQKGQNGMKLKSPHTTLTGANNLCSCLYINIRNLSVLPSGYRSVKNLDIMSQIMPLTSRIIGRSMILDDIVIGYCDEQQPIKNNQNTNNKNDKNATTSAQIYVRRYEDSWLEITLPFSKQKSLRDGMIRMDKKHIRIGKLIEIVDTLAGDVAYRHTGSFQYGKEQGEQQSNMTIMTASFNGLKFNGLTISILHDLKIRAYLTYVGKTSMEVKVEIITIQSDNLQEITVGQTLVTMVARAISHKKNDNNNSDINTQIYGLYLDGEDSDILKQRYEEGKLRAFQRQSNHIKSFSKTAPTADEISIIHDLYLTSKQLKAQKDSLLQGISTSENIHKGIFKWMKSTELKNTLLMYPQEMNIHGKIFGGFLMRTALELSRVTAMTYVGKHFPILLSVEKMRFIMPVSIGTIIEFTGTVIYSHSDKFVVQVIAEEINPASSTKQITNKFTYIYQGSSTSECESTKDDVTIKINPVIVPRIVPKEYEEFISYLQGKRTFDEYLQDEDGTNSL